MNFLEKYGLIVSAVALPLVTSIVANATSMNVPTTLTLCLLEATTCLTLDIAINVRSNKVDGELTQYGVVLTQKTETGKALRKILSNIQAISDAAHPLLLSYKLKLLEEFLQKTDDLADGKICAEVQPRFLMRETHGLEYAKHTVLATSMVATEKYWSTNWGKEYLEKNRRLVEKKVKVTRIFIDRKSNLAALKGVIDQQSKCGVDVRVCFIEELPGQLQKDMMIIDDWLLVQLQVDREGLPIAAELSVDKRQAENAINEYAEILKYSHTPGEMESES